MNACAEGRQPRPAIGYARVSTDEQAREGVSLEVQRKRIEAYCTAKGLHLTEVLADEGLSGKNLKRPALQELLARCNRGEVGDVVVLKLDRLSRCARDLLMLVEDVFLDREIQLHSVHESLDTSSATGKFVLTMLGSLAEMERQLIAERTKSALAYKRENGQPTSHAPYGFKSNGSRERMVPVARELVIVRRILRAWRLGQSYRTIAAKLTAEGVPTKRGGRWHHSTVAKVIARRSYYETALGPF